MKKIIFILLVICIITPLNAFAKDIVKKPWNTKLNCLKNVSSKSNNNCWIIGKFNSFGDVNKSSNITFRIINTPKTKSYVVGQIGVKGTDGKYILFASKTRTTKVIENNITGLPSLWGSALDKKGESLSYFQGDTMLFSAPRGVYDYVAYGVYKIPNDTNAVKFKFDQGLRSGFEFNGTPAWFRDSGIYVVDSPETAAKIVDRYNASLNTFNAKQIKLPATK